jgi:hypothetical protein
VRQILRSSWFSRLWVVQELALASEALFCWGHAQIHFGELYGAALCGDVLTWVTELASRNSLPDLLRYTRALSCSDELGRIYGLLGLCDKSHPLSNAVAELVPNYCQSEEELFSDIASLFVEHASSFELLAQVDESLGSDTAFPSWVPDWRLPQISEAFSYARGRETNSHYSSQSSAVADRSARILIIRGVRLDTLSDFMLSHSDTNGMTVVWIKLISIVHHQSLAFGELALLRLLDKPKVDEEMERYELW